MQTMSTIKPATPWWRGRGLWWAAAVVIAVLAVLWWRLKPLAVDATQARTQPLVRSLQFSARVQTPARVEVGTTITGRVARVLVHEGDAVKAGSPLIELEADESRAALSQAQANWQQAQARLGSQQALSLPNAQASLAQAEANVLAAERDLVRVRELVASKFYSPARLDEALRTSEVARAQRDAARAQRSVNGQGGAERVAVQAQLQGAQAAVAVAQSRLDQATVRSPGPGRVLLRQVEPGQIVQAGHALLTLSVVGPVELVAQVDERFLGQLQRGQHAKVLADAYPGQPFDARLDRLAPSVDAQRGSVEVTFVVDGAAPTFLREDMTLSIEVVTGERSQARVLPLRALRTAAAGASADRATVLVVEQGRATERSVTLGLRTLDQVEVTGGLSNEDTVVLDATVVPGTRVKPRSANSKGGAAAQGTSQGNVGGAISGTFSR